jgi:hypothetical protein
MLILIIHYDFDFISETNMKNLDCLDPTGFYGPHPKPIIRPNPIYMVYYINKLDVYNYI